MMPTLSCIHHFYFWSALGIFHKSQKLNEIQALQPKGKQKARTIQGIWHNMNLNVTAQKTINKKGVESIVYQVSIYFTKPSEHVKIYKKRWPIEKMFRTTKQYLGLQECQSRKMETQLNHIASVFLAYAHVVIQQKKKRFKSPEEPLKAIRLKNERILKKNNELTTMIESSLSAHC